MNYLTNYYKNLSEQLQERINILEARIRSPSEMRQMGGAEMMDELSGEPNPTPKINAGYSPWARRAERREEMIRNATARMGDVARAGDIETAQQFADVMGDMTANPNVRDPRNKDAGLGGMLAAEQEDIARGEEVIRPSLRDRSLAQEEKARQEAIAARASGKLVHVPADIAAMRKFIQMGRPPQGPARDLNPNVHDGPDTDTTASSMEVAASQQRRQLSPQKPDYWFGNTINRL